MPRFTFDPASGRFRNSATGRFVEPQTIRRELDRAVAAADARVFRLSTQYRDGTVSLAAWEAGMKAEIKAMHLAAAFAAKGGREQMTQSDFGRTGQLIRRNYDYLKGFRADIVSGKTTPGQLARRSTLYTSASRGVFHQFERTEMLSRNFQEERNVLGSSEHCDGCLAESARGWVAIGSLLPVGGRRPCLTNCACALEYRRAP